MSNAQLKSNESINWRTANRLVQQTAFQMSKDTGKPLEKIGLPSFMTYCHEKSAVPRSHGQRLRFSEFASMGKGFADIADGGILLAKGTFLVIAFIFATVWDVFKEFWNYKPFDKKGKDLGGKTKTK